MKTIESKVRPDRARRDLGAASLVTKGNDGFNIETGGLRAKPGISHD